MSEPTYQPLFDCLLRITGKAFTEDEMSEIKNVCNSEVETLLKEEREKFRLRTLQYSAVQEQLQQKEDEISILAGLVKGRDLTIKQKDEEIERIKSEWKADNKFQLKEKSELKSSLTSYRELMGRMARCLKIVDDLHKYEMARELVTDYKNLEGC